MVRIVNNMLFFTLRLLKSVTFICPSVSFVLVASSWHELISFLVLYLEYLFIINQSLYFSYIFEGFTARGDKVNNHFFLFLFLFFFLFLPVPVTLQMLYKLKTSKVFEKSKPGDGRAAELVEEDPFAVQMVSWCPQSRIFCVVGISAHIILYRFSKYDANTQIVVSAIKGPNEKEWDPGWYSSANLFWHSCCPKMFSAHNQNMTETYMTLTQWLSWLVASILWCLCHSQSLEVRLQCEAEDVISPSENENNPCFSEPGSHSPQPPHHQQQQHPASPSSGTPEGIPCLK